MLKRFLIIPIVLVLLGIAFVIISFLVNVTRGNHKLLKKKLIIGGLIITFTAMLNGQVWAQQDPDVNCYEMVISTPIIEIYNTQAQGEIVLELPVENIITGRIQENSGQSYSFKITDSNNKVVQQGELVANDGAFDQQTEEFEITVDSSLATGNYKLYFYECDLQTQKNNPDILSFCVYVLKVIETAVMCYFY